MWRIIGCPSFFWRGPGTLPSMERNMVCEEVIQLCFLLPSEAGDSKLVQVCVLFLFLKEVRTVAPPASISFLCLFLGQGLSEPLPPIKPLFLSRKLEWHYLCAPFLRSSKLWNVWLCGSQSLTDIRAFHFVEMFGQPPCNLLPIPGALALALFHSRSYCRGILCGEEWLSDKFWLKLAREFLEKFLLFWLKIERHLSYSTPPLLCALKTDMMPEGRYLAVLKPWGNKPEH